MATDADFEAHWNWRQATTTDIAGHMKELEAMFPSFADKRRYYKWSKERRAREAAQKPTVTPISRNDLIEMIAKMNYNSAIDRSKLVSAVQQSIVP